MSATSSEVFKPGTPIVITMRTGDVFIGEVVDGMTYYGGEMMWVLTKVANVLVADASERSVKIGFRPVAAFSATPWGEKAAFHEKDMLMRYTPVGSMEDAWRAAVSELDLTHGKTARHKLHG